MTYNLSRPITAQIEITEDCNHKCIFCYNYFRDGSIPFKKMSPELGQKVITSLDDLGLFTLTITGGEPFMNKETLYSMLSQLEKTKIRTGINTNAALINDNDIARLKDSPISSVLVSLHHIDEKSSNDITNSKTYKRTLNSIDKLQKAGIFTAVNMVTMKSNYNLVYSLGNFLNTNYGITAFSATPVSPMNLTHNDLMLSPTQLKSTLDDLLLLQRDKGMSVDVLEVIPRCFFDDVEKYSHFMNRSCSAGSSALAIGSDATVRPCTHSDDVAGNLILDDFETIWENMADWRNKSFYPEECKSCLESDYCTSGCRVSAKSLFGDITSNDPYMVGEIKNIRFKNNTFKKINTQENYVLNKQMQIRPETDSSFVLFDGRSRVNLVNGSFVLFLNELSKKEKFKPLNVNYSNLNKKEIEGLLTMMYNNNYIQRANDSLWNHPNI